jgi:PAS domain S-box-containing protein
MMSRLRVLHVEDSEHDFALVKRHLSRAEYDVVSLRVETASAMAAVLPTHQWDVILCDYSMPEFSALAALNLVKEMSIDIPFIVISGTIGEALAVEAMRAGAHDYLIKDNLARLVPVIEREINEADNRRARREAEDNVRLQSAALEVAANAIVIINREGEILWANPAFTETGDYPFDAAGVDPAIANSGGQDRSFCEEMWATMLSGKVWRNTIMNRRKDGTFCHEVLTITPIRDRTNVITHFVGIKQDITEVKLAEEALQLTNVRLAAALEDLQNKSLELTAMTQQLWQASKLATMGELAASVAHELNNPLATMLLRLEALTSELNGDQKKSEAVEIVIGEVERMGTLVAGLLQFSRGSQQQISAFDVREEIDNTLKLIEYQLRRQKIDVAREFDASVPMMAADRQQLRQVFLNLLTNAIDAMPCGGKLIARVGSVEIEDGVSGVNIEFIDSGAGIAPADLARIWEPFFTTKPPGKGTGLGLAICRRLIEEHKGTISIDSRPNEGTTLKISLPAASDGESELEQMNIAQ